MVSSQWSVVSGLRKIVCVSLILTFHLLPFTSEGQEILLPLQTAPVHHSQAIKQSSAQTITLPLFEDFSSPHSALSTFHVPLSAQISDGARLLPPTVGVVTLDAIDASGNLYPGASTVLFSADTLLSLPIRLEGYVPADSLVFSFYYLPGGGEGDLWQRIGDAPDPQDSLLLEFYRPADSSWTIVWSRGGVTVDSLVSSTGLHWQYVSIVITEPAYFDSLFRFRFRNFCSLPPTAKPGLAGNCDFWHLDYFVLDAHRTKTPSPVFHDVAFVSPVPSALAAYRAMPVRQYRASEMADHFDMTIDNLFDSPLATQYHYAVVDATGDTLYRYDGGYENAPAFLPDESYQTAAPHAEPPVSFSFPLGGSFLDTQRTTFTIVHTVREGVGGDDFPSNDTVRFSQVFDNYYAYDDGSAENGYGLTSTGSHLYIAYRFDLNEADTLTALDLYFNRTLDGGNEQVPFLITVWQADNGKPGTVLYRDQSNRRPQFDSLNSYQRYILDSPVVVDGSIFVGFEQGNNNYINLGFDRSFNTADRIYYRTSNEWQQSILSGSLMLRPCFGAAATVGIETSHLSPVTFHLFPNPASDRVTIEGLPAGSRLELYDSHGRQVYSNNNFHLSPFTFHLSPGLYLLRAITPDGTSHVEKMIIHGRH